MCFGIEFYDAEADVASLLAAGAPDQSPSIPKDWSFDLNIDSVSGMQSSLWIKHPAEEDTEKAGSLGCINSEDKGKVYQVPGGKSANWQG